MGVFVHDERKDELKEMAAKIDAQYASIAESTRSENDGRSKITSTLFSHILDTLLPYVLIAQHQIQSTLLSQSPQRLCQCVHLNYSSY